MSELFEDPDDQDGRSPRVDAFDPDEVVVSLIANHQVSLLSYAVGLLGNRADAQDLVQRTNTTIWRRRSTFSKSMSSISGPTESSETHHFPNPSDSPRPTFAS